jgi:hypothetical protein
MSKKLRDYFEATEYLGAFVGEKVPFLFKTSCMNPDERVRIAILDWLINMQNIDLSKLTEIESIQKVIMPLIENMGFAKWIRDTVTDMAIRKGRSGISERFGKPDGSTNAES